MTRMRSSTIIKTALGSIRPHTITILLFLIALCYLLSYSNYGINLWDEGVLLNGATRLLHGELPIKDFQGYMPGRHFLLALFFKIFGATTLTARFVGCILGAIMVTLIFKISRTIMGHLFSLVPCLLLLSAPSMYYNRFYPFASLLCLWALIQTYRGKMGLTQMMVYVCVAFLFKPEIAFIALGVLLITATLVNNPPPSLTANRILKSALIFTVAVLAFLLLYLGSWERLVHYAQKTSLTAFCSKTSWSTPFPQPHTYNPFTQFNEFLENLLFYLVPLTYIICVTTTFFTLRKRNEPRHGIIFIISIFGLATYGLVVWRAGLGNLVRCITPFYILLAEGLRHMFHELRCQLHTKPVRCVLYDIASFSIMIIFVLLIAYDFNINNGYFIGSVGAIFEGNHVLNIPKLKNIRMSESHAVWVEGVVKYITTHSDNGDFIFCMPFNPIWHFLSDRKNPTYYEWILPGDFQDEPEKLKLINSLARSRPKLIIFIDIAIDNIDERRIVHYAPWLYNMIKQKYFLQTRIGPFSIFELKDSCNMNV